MPTKCPSSVSMTTRTSSVQAASERTICQSPPPGSNRPRNRSPSKRPPVITPTRRSMLGVLPMTVAFSTCSRKMNSGRVRSSFISLGRISSSEGVLTERVSLLWCDVGLGQHSHRIFHETLEGGQQLCAEHAVHHAVIAGKRHRHDADKGDATVWSLHRLSPHGADRKDGGVRRIDDGGEFAHTMHAEVRNRGSAALIFLRFEATLAGAGRQVFHFR